MKILVGLYKPTEGKVLIHGKNKIFCGGKWLNKRKGAATRSFWEAKVFMRNFLRFNRRNTALSRSWVASRLKLENFFKKTY